MFRNIIGLELPCNKEGYARFRYTVSDTGIGMSREFLSHVFEPFSRAESATKCGVVGTGLGMSITKSLVELMNGTITIESELGAGTIVQIEFENKIAEPVDQKKLNAKEGQYDLILMDIQMPKMNGYDATRAIRELPNSYAANIPIIAMTANAFEEDIKNAFEAKMNAHIAKPIDVPKLLNALSEIFRFNH